MVYFLLWLYNELGLRSLVESTRDAKILCMQRFVRLFAYGGSALILALYLSSLGNSEEFIGLFLTLTLIGDVVISFLLTLVADALGRRNILVLGATLMAVSGIIFAIFENYWILLVAAIVGVISPTGNEIGPFRAVEESTLAQISATDRRTDIFAWYTLIGFAGAAIGQVASGWIIANLQRHGWSNVESYRAVFIGYAALGAVKLVLILFLTKSVEQGQASPKKQPVSAVEEATTTDEDANDPRQPLLGPDQSPSAPSTANAPGDSSQGSPNPTTSSEDTVKPTAPSKKRSLIPPISRQTLPTILKLTGLFAIDSFASGLIPASFIALYFNTYHSLGPGPLGTFFATTSALSAASNLVSASLARRLGLVQTMVLTHLPSSIFLALVPFPDNKHTVIAMAFLALRACTSTMDAAPRQAFLSSVVKPEERTAVMGWINVVKTLAQSVGPSVGGALFARGEVLVAFVVAGGLKAAYDLAIAGSFWGFGRREREARAERQRESEGNGETQRMNGA